MEYPFSRYLKTTYPIQKRQILLKRPRPRQSNWINLNRTVNTAVYTSIA